VGRSARERSPLPHKPVPAGAEPRLFANFFFNSISYARDEAQLGVTNDDRSARRFLSPMRQVETDRPGFGPVGDFRLH
jgi:hypothetical protein